MTTVSSTQATPLPAVDASGTAGAIRKPAGAGAASEVDAPFEASLAEASKGSVDLSTSTLKPSYRGSKSGVLTPVQQFESFVLRSFVETMLPQENSSFFGTGTAGSIWKSMLAERIGDEMARDGGIGIAELLASRGTAAGAVDEAKATLAGSDTLSVDAAKLKGAGSI